MHATNVIARGRQRRDVLGPVTAGMAGAVLLAALLTAAPASAAEPGLAGAPASSVRYEAATRTLYATGGAAIRHDDPTAIAKAYAEAEGRARLDALAALTAHVYGIETPSGAVGQIVERDPRRKTLVDSYIQGAKFLGRRYPAVDRLEVDVELNLTSLDAILHE